MTGLIRWSGGRNDVLEDVDRLFDGFLPIVSGNRWAHNNGIAGELSEDEDNIYAALELPGVDKKDVKVIINDGVLTISGEKKQETANQKKHYYRSERHYGQFQRSFALPSEVNIAQVKAEFQDGVLNVTLPKAEAAKPKEIKVNIS